MGINLVIDSIKGEVESICSQISAEISEQLGKVEIDGLCSGNIGLLLFLVENEAAFPGSVGLDKIQNYLSEFQDSVDYRKLPPRMDRGLVGIAWAQEYIQRQYGDPNDDINGEFDALLMHYLNTEKWTGEYELLGGLTGIGVYAVTRARFPSGQQLLKRVIDHLVDLSEEQEEGIAWPTTESSTYFTDSGVDKEYNLGIAHGNPGVLAFLVKASAVTDDQRVLSMLKSSCSWLISNKLHDEATTYFSYQAHKCSNSRIAWCYGDISNALTLWRAGKVLGNDSVCELAQNIAVNAAAKRTQRETIIFDAGLCHGTAGNMLIFQELYKEMKDPRLLECAQFWLDETLKLKRESPGLTGLNRWLPDEPEKVECFGLLEGLSGIGLCLLSAMGFSSHWKECFLLE